MNREEAISVLKQYEALGCGVCLQDDLRNNLDAEEALKMAIEALQDRPSGEWQKVDEQPYFRKHFDNVCCSVCQHKGMRKYNYCPNCGARMENNNES